jgi:hypothetical protein
MRMCLLKDPHGVLMDRALNDAWLSQQSTSKALLHD